MRHDIVQLAGDPRARRERRHAPSVAASSTDTTVEAAISSHPGVSARSFHRAAASTAPTTAHAVAAAPIRAAGPYATTVYTAISAMTSPATMWSSAASCARHSTLTVANTATGARRRNGTVATNAIENARPTTTSSSEERSLGRTNASSSKPARHASPATGRSSYQRANRDITHPRISGGAPHARFAPTGS